MNLRKIVIESPFRATEHFRSEQHLAYLDYCKLDCLQRRETYIASHGEYAGYLDDEDQLERAFGIACGYAWGAHADAVAVYSDFGVSQGMSDAIAHYKALGKPIEWRTLNHRIVMSIKEMASG